MTARTNSDDEEQIVMAACDIKSMEKHPKKLWQHLLSLMSLISYMLWSQLKAQRGGGSYMGAFLPTPDKIFHLVSTLCQLNQLKIEKNKEMMKGLRLILPCVQGLYSRGRGAQLQISPFLDLCFSLHVRCLKFYVN